MEGSKLWRLLLQIGLLSKVEFQQTESFNISNFHSKDKLPNSLLFQVSILELLEQAKRQMRFESFVILQYENDQEDCIWRYLLQHLNAPMLIIDVSNDWIVRYKYHYNKKAIILHCVPPFREGFVIERLHHVIYLHDFPANETEERLLLTKTCRNAFNAQLYNVLLILPNFGVTQRYFQCHLYPLDAENPYRSKKLFYGDKSTAPIYDEQFFDMHGAIIWTQPDQVAPRSMLEKHGDDPANMIGFVASLVKLYAERHNATLQYRWPTNFREVFSPEKLINATLNGSLDIATSLSSLNSNSSFGMFSYPYDIGNFCFMIPLPSEIPIRLVPFFILNISVLLIIILYMFLYGCLLLYSIIGSWHRMTLNNLSVFFDMIRAMLAQSFSMVPRPRQITKFIYFLISFSGYIVASMYQAFIQSFMTHPPLQPAIHDLNDAKRMGLKIMFPNLRMKLFDEFFNENKHFFGEMLMIIDDLSYFDRKRSSLDTTYIFPVHIRRWNIFDEQQKYFQRRVFFYSDALCSLSDLLLCLPTRPDLPYRDDFNQFMLHVQAVGLVDHWTSWSFYDMIRLGFMTTEDPSIGEVTGEAITLDDFYWIWIGYCCLITIAIIELFFEIIFNAFAKRRVQGN